MKSNRWCCWDNNQPQREASSSLPSAQSGWPLSHFREAGMHCPLEHLKFIPPQLVPHVSVISSLPSEQSLFPSHLDEAQMHCPLEQANPSLSPIFSQLSPHSSVVSSLPSVQAMNPLHISKEYKHCPLEQANLPSIFSHLAPHVSGVSSLPSRQLSIPLHL